MKIGGKVKVYYEHTLEIKKITREKPMNWDVYQIVCDNCEGKLDPYEWWAIKEDDGHGEALEVGGEYCSEKCAQTYLDEAKESNAKLEQMIYEKVRNEKVKVKIRKEIKDDDTDQEIQI